MKRYEVTHTEFDEDALAAHLNEIAGKGGKVFCILPKPAYEKLVISNIGQRSNELQPPRYVVVVEHEPQDING